MFLLLLPPHPHPLPANGIFDPLGGGESRCFQTNDMYAEEKNFS